MRGVFLPARRCGWPAAVALLVLLAGGLCRQEGWGGSRKALAAPLPRPDPEAAAAPAAAASPAARPAPASAETFRPEDLKSSDSKLASLAAMRLLRQITGKDHGSSASEKAAELTQYVEQQLAPDPLRAPGASTVVAERIVNALATWLTSSGSPLDNTADLLLPLVGVGPKSLRESVVRAYQALVYHETAAAGNAAVRSPSLARLLARFKDKAAPDALFVHDAARIGWETDAKGLLETLILALAARAPAAPATDAHSTFVACLEELRGRIPRDLPDVAAWQAWWKENEALSLEEILARCWEANYRESAANWKQMVRRLRETGSAERLLLAIQDTLSSLRSPQLRVAAVTALGDYADWVVAMRLDDGKPIDGGSRDRLLGQAVQTLEPLLVGKEDYTERRSVSLAALSALRKYHAFIEKKPEIRERISALVSRKLLELRRRKGGNGHEEILEALRLAGTLRVEAAREFVDELLSPAGGAARPGDGLELQTVAVTTLGRLLEEKGAGPAGAALLISCFKSHQGKEKAVRALRRACVSALGSGGETPEVRKQLQEFHKAILSSGDDKDLRIPAILALGTLARQGDHNALETLLDVLEGLAQFEPQEVIAAINSIAYVGGPEALHGFLKNVVLAEDKSVRQQLAKKTSALVVAGGIQSLADVLDQLKGLAVMADLPRYLEFARTLWKDPPVGKLLASARQNPGGEEHALALFRALAARASIEDYLGAPAEVKAAVSELNDLLQKNAELKKKCPQCGAELLGFKNTLAARDALSASLSKGTAPDAAHVVQQAGALVASGKAAFERLRNLEWIYRQLSGAPSSPRTEQVRRGVYVLLGAEQNKPLWEGIPAAFRDRYLQRLDALKPKAPTAPAKAPGK